MVSLTTVFKWSFVVKIYAGLSTGIGNRGRFSDPDLVISITRINHLDRLLIEIDYARGTLVPRAH